MGINSGPKTDPWGTPVCLATQSLENVFDTDLLWLVYDGRTVRVLLFTLRLLFNLTHALLHIKSSVFHLIRRTHKLSTLLISHDNGASDTLILIVKHINVSSVGTQCQKKPQIIVQVAQQFEQHEHQRQRRKWTSPDLISTLMWRMMRMSYFKSITLSFVKLDPA